MCHVFEDSQHATAMQGRHLGSQGAAGAQNMTDIVSVHLAIVIKRWLASLASRCVPEATNENTDLCFGMLLQ